MARFLPNTTYGKLDDFIVYKYRGKPCIRSMPAEVRQTEATKKKATVFGKAARMGRVIREGIDNLYKDLGDKTVMNRLNGALVKCLKKENEPEYARLVGFEFTEYSSLGGRIKKFPELAFKDDGMPVLSFPLFRKGHEFIVPAFAVNVILKISAVCVDPEDPDESLQTWGVCYELTEGVLQPEQLEIPFTNTKGQLILVGAALRYYTDDRKDFLSLKEKWVPTGIVAVGYDGRIPVLEDE